MLPSISTNSKPIKKQTATKKA